MEPERWWQLWEVLCRRFGRQPLHDEAAMYLEYLDALLAPWQIESAVRAVWADREFFPRPADFVAAAHSDVLAKLRRAAWAHQSEPHAGTWALLVGVPDSLAFRVLKELGGITEVVTLLNRGTSAFRQVVEAEMSELLREDARQLPPLLPANEERSLPKPTSSDGA